MVGMENIYLFIFIRGISYILSTLKKKFESCINNLDLDYEKQIPLSLNSSLFEIYLWLKTATPSKPH